MNCVRLQLSLVTGEPLKPGPSSVHKQLVLNLIPSIQNKRKKKKSAPSGRGVGFKLAGRCPVFDKYQCTNDIITLFLLNYSFYLL